MIKTLIFLSVFLLVSPAQLAPVATGSVIDGILSGDDGTPILGGSILLKRRLSSSGRERKLELRTVSAASGAFRFSGLPEGQYTLCAQVPSSTWMNSCEWSLTPSVVSILRGQPSVSITLVMRNGVAVPIRIEDPGQSLSRYEGSTAAAHLLLGVSSDTFVFHPASLISQDAIGRNYQIVIPFDAAARLIVYSSFFQLSNGVGVPLPKTGSTALPVTVPAGQNPSVIRLIVTGSK